MKPRVFLSHSKKDEEFIKQIADALRKARIEVWFDDWEIPPGESITKKIFDDGLPSCHLFLVYLTEHSINSYWVKQELESMIFMESETGLAKIFPFVDRASLRTQLSPFLKSRITLELNDQNFSDILYKIIARSWEIFGLIQIEGNNKSAQLSKLYFENKILTLENRILEMQAAGSNDFLELTINLKNTVFQFNQVKFSLYNIFAQISILLGEGVGRRRLLEKLAVIYQYSSEEWGFPEPDDALRTGLGDILGNLVVLGLVNRTPSAPYVNEEYCLSDLGIMLSGRILLAKSDE